MNLKSMLRASLAVVAVGSFGFAPSLAQADPYGHRQNQKDQWKDLAIGSGILGTIGLLSHNDTLTTIGAAGVVYSAYRYEEEEDSHGWFHMERGHRIYDRDYRPARNRDWDRDRDFDRDRGQSRDWNRGGDRDRSRDQDWNRGHDRDRNQGSDRNRDRDSNRDGRSGRDGRNDSRSGNTNGGSRHDRG